MRKGIEQRPNQSIINEGTKITPDAFGAIFEEYHPRILRYLAVKTGHPATAEDLAADTFEKALRAHETFNSNRGSLNSWLFRIARNTLIDYRRRQNMNHSLVFQEAEAMTNNTTFGDPEKAFEARSINDAVRKAVSGLPTEKQRTLIALKLTSPLSNKEIAKRLHTNEPDVKTSMHRALRKVRNAVEEELAA